MTDCSCTNFPASLGNVTFGASVGIGATDPAAPLVVVGTGASLVGSAGVVADHAGASTDRVRLTFGNTNASTGPGATSRSTELMFYGATPDGTALRAMFELGTDAEQTGAQSLFVYDDVAKIYRLYLGPTGNLGVGTSTPTAALHIKQDTANVIALVDTAADAESSQLALGAAGELVWQIYKPGGIKDLRFARSGVGDQVTIQDGSGNVGIGTASPGQKLSVQGNISLTDGTGTLILSPTNAAPPSTPALRVTDTGDAGLAVSANPLRLNWDAPAGSPIYLTNGAQNIVATVAGNGYVGIGTTSPGYPLDVVGTIRLNGGGLLCSNPIVVQGTKVADQAGCYYAD